ncbi:MAG: hypothetical protein K6E83_00970 [Clostridium sp.]|nr:hypothetical protein [Clostridium sp.]
MLEQKRYTFAEIASILHTKTNKGIRSKLTSRKIPFRQIGEGKSAVFEILDIPNPFALFCEEKLGFNVQCNFTKIRNLFYFCFNDEEFFEMPDEFKVDKLDSENKHVSRPSIAKYLDHLYNAGWFAKSSECFFYYFAYGDHREYTDHQTYLEAWHDYWGKKEESGNYSLAAATVIIKYGGMPRRQAIPEPNALSSKELEELIALTNKSFEADYGSGK